MNFTRFEGNPIISPSSNWWESQATFNPAATIFDGKIILLYRAVGEDNVSRFGFAESTDGKEFNRFAEALLEAEKGNMYEELGIEDPRITKIYDTYYIVYTAASFYPDKTTKSDLPFSALHPGNWRIRTALMTTEDFKKFKRYGNLFEIATKDGVLFPEKINDQFILLHRIYPNMNISKSLNLKDWDKGEVLLTPRKGYWDSERVGSSGVPIKTEFGWLLFYHGVDQNHVYRVGIVVFDLLNFSKVLYRSKQPVFEPVETYEKDGLTPNVVFLGGIVELNSNFYLYYGAADKVTCLATINKEKLFSDIQSNL